MLSPKLKPVTPDGPKSYSNNVKDVDANSLIGPNGVHAQLRSVGDFKKENEIGRSRMV